MHVLKQIIVNAVVHALNWSFRVAVEVGIFCTDADQLGNCWLSVSDVFWLASREVGKTIGFKSCDIVDWKMRSVDIVQLHHGCGGDCLRREIEQACWIQGETRDRWYLETACINYFKIRITSSASLGP